MSAAVELANLESYDDFRVRWGWAATDRLDPGFTAVVRVKNEAESLPFVLPPLLRAVRRVIVIDNGSTDGTPRVARQAASAAGAADRLDVLDYPFEVARCGPDHLATPPTSVHSLTYFYNWSFSHVRSTYAMKWDGDMVLTDTGVEAVRDLAWQLESVERQVTTMRYPLYVADAHTGFLDISVVNREPWAWPNREGFEFTKAFEWELPRWPRELKGVTLPDWSCVELKHLDVDEFAHWSARDFGATGRTARKQREYDVFQALSTGGPPPYGVLEVRSPDDRHVVDYVCGEWLPNQREELSAQRRKVLLRMALQGR